MSPKPAASAISPPQRPELGPDWFEEKLKDPAQLAAYRELLEEDEEEDEAEGVDGKTFLNELRAELAATGRIAPP